MARLWILSLVICLPAAAAEPLVGNAVPLFTPARVATLERLHRDGHPWAKFVQEFADREPPPYADLGHWSLVTWKMTGDERYARAAIERASTAFQRETRDRNFTRSCGTWFALNYMWLREYMTPAERAEWESKLDWWARGMLGLGEPGLLTRLEDSDELIAHYFGLRMITRALSLSDARDADGNPRWADYLALQPGDGTPSVNRMRAALAEYCTTARGGEWSESSHYNPETLQLLLLGYAAIGPDEFPEITALLPELAEQFRWQVTDDLAAGVQWGDEQIPHSLHLNTRVAAMSMVAGLLQDRGQRHAKAESLLAKLIADKPIYPHYWFDLWRAILFLDPATLPVSLTVEHPRGLRVAEGTGLAIFRQPGVLLQVHMPPVQQIGGGMIDHAVPYLADVRLYAGGEWVIDHPLGYAADWRAVNGGLLSGLGHMAERGMLSARQTDRGCEFAAETKGPRHHLPYWDPPPAFGQWKRLVSYEPGRLQVTDLFAGDKPARVDRYYPYERDAISSALALWEQLWHAPVEPTATARGFTWQTKGGQRVELVTNAAKRIVRKHELGVTMLGFFHPAELEGWQISLGSDEPEATIETMAIIGHPPVGPPPDQPRPTDELPKVTLPSRVELRRFSDRIERVEIFPVVP